MKSSRPSTYDSTDSIAAGRSGNRHILIWGLLATLFFVTVFSLNPTTLQILDRINYDLLLRHFPNHSASSRLVIVDLDEKSLDQYGQWPWPRNRMAGLFQKIAAMEPAVVGLDIVFAELDRTSPARSPKDSAAADDSAMAVDRSLREPGDNDLILAETLARGPFVLGNHFLFNGQKGSSHPCILHPVTISLLQPTHERAEDPAIPEGTGVLCNLPILSEKVSASGFCNFRPDPSGTLRHLPLLIRYRGEVYASLALAVALKMNNTSQILLKKDRDNLHSIHYAGTSVPVDRQGRMMVKFRGPKRSYDYISAADIMDNRVAPKRLRGRIAFVGTSAVGLRELRTTPLDPMVPGVEVHATAVDNLLTGDFISIPNYSNGIVFAIILISGLFLASVIAYKSILSCLIIMLLIIAGLWLTTQQLFFKTGLFVGTSFPIASIIANYVFLTVIKYNTENKRAEVALRESEARFRKLFENAPTPMCQISLDGKILAINDRLIETMGYTPTDNMPSLEYASSLLLPDPDLRDEMTAKWRTELACAIADHSDIRSFECPLLCKDGTVRSMVIGTRLIGDSIIVSFFDITDLKEAEREREKLQNQLHQSHKLEAVGILAGGVAHDFNNMLGAIIGYAELTMVEMDSTNPFRTYLDRILDAAQRSANLTRQLLAFARKQTIAPIVFDLNAAVEAIIKMVRRLIGENIQLIWSPAATPCIVSMDPSQFDQILINLCVNARDAVERIGTITIETGTETFDEAYCRSHPDFVQGTYVTLSVTDDGCGMDEDTLGHIFEPFFTTKALGKGTGMGLASVYGIIKQNKGFITVHSKPGKGTKFRVFIPYNFTEELSERSEHTDIPRSKGEIILIVEDNENLLEMSVMMLKHLGYSVLSANTPNEAIRIAKETIHGIQLIITDVVMPEMNGRELADLLQQIHPSTKCLFMSGYTTNVIVHQDVLDKGVHFIQKPFSLKDIAIKIREILD